MKYIIIIIYIFFLQTFQYLYSDDATFGAKGNTIIPLQENAIILKKEKLDLKYKNWKMEVSVLFEFLNPNESKDLLIGFVSPPSVSYFKPSKPKINNFTVTVNGLKINYNLDKISESSFANLKKNVNSEIDYYVYSFKVFFKKGINKVIHSYIYSGVDYSDGINIFYYTLETGKLWGNYEIEDFELNIDIKKELLFTVPFSFEKKEKNNLWEIKGNGKYELIQKSSDYYFSDFSNEYINNNQIHFYIKKGILTYHKEHFKPDLLLSIEFNPHKYYNEDLSSYSRKKDKKLFDLLLNISSTINCPELDEPLNNNEIIRITDTLEKISKDDLILLKNSMLAYRGYQFKDKDVTKYFSKFIWYIPIENNDIVNNIFSRIERDIYDIIEKIVQKK